MSHRRVCACHPQVFLDHFRRPHEVDWRWRRGHGDPVSESEEHSHRRKESFQVDTAGDDAERFQWLVSGRFESDDVRNGESENLMHLDPGSWEYFESRWGHEGYRSIELKGAPWKRLFYLFSLLAAALMVMSLLSLVYLVVAAVHLLQWRYINNGKDRGWLAKLSWRFFGTAFIFTKYYALAVLGTQLVFQLVMLEAGDLGFTWSVLGFVPASGWRLAVRLALDSSVFVTSLLCKEFEPAPFESPTNMRNFATFEHLMASVWVTLSACTIAAVAAPTLPSMVYLVVVVAYLMQWASAQPGERRLLPEARTRGHHFLRYFCILHLLLQHFYTVLLHFYIGEGLNVRLFFRTDDAVQVSEWIHGVKHYIHLQDLGIFILYMSLTFQHMLLSAHSYEANAEGLFAKGVNIFGLTNPNELMALTMRSDLSDEKGDMKPLGEGEEGGMEEGELQDFGRTMSGGLLKEPFSETHTNAAADPSMSELQRTHSGSLTEMSRLPIFGQGRDRESGRGSSLKVADSTRRYAKRMQRPEAMRIGNVQDSEGEFPDYEMSLVWKFQVYVSDFLASYGNLVACVTALTWSMIFFSFQSLILMVVCAVLRPGVNYILNHTFHKGLILCLVFYYVLLVLTNFCVNLDVSDAERNEYARWISEWLHHEFGVSSLSPYPETLMAGISELGFDKYSYRGTMLLIQIILLFITAACARCTAPVLFQNEKQERKAHCPCGCKCLMDSFLARVPPEDLSAWENLTSISYTFTVRWMWMLTVFLIYVYGLNQLVVFSTVYLVGCVLSLVFFDYHLFVFGLMILYGQGVVFMTCIWQYSWIKMTAAELDHWESLVGLRRVADKNEVWRYIVPYIAVLGLVGLSRVTFAKRCQWDLHMNRGFIQLKLCKKESQRMDSLQNQLRERTELAKLLQDPDSDVGTKMGHVGRLEEVAGVQEQIKQLKDESDAAQDRWIDANKLRMKYAKEIGPHPQDEAYQLYLGETWQRLTKAVGGWNSYDAPVVCYCTFILISLRTPVNMVQFFYLVYLFLCFVLHVPDLYIFRAEATIAATWFLPTVFAAIHLILKYAYQFQPIEDWANEHWDGYGNITMTEIGFQKMDHRVLEVLQLTSVVLLCLVQWRVYLAKGHEKEIEENLVRYSLGFAQAVLKKVRRMVTYQLDASEKRARLRELVHVWLLNSHSAQLAFMQSLRPFVIASLIDLSDDAKHAFTRSSGVREFLASHVEAGAEDHGLTKKQMLHVTKTTIKSVAHHFKNREVEAGRESLEAMPASVKVFHHQLVNLLMYDHRHTVRVTMTSFKVNYYESFRRRLSGHRESIDEGLSDPLGMRDSRLSWDAKEDMTDGGALDPPPLGDSTAAEEEAPSESSPKPSRWGRLSVDAIRGTAEVDDKRAEFIRQKTLFDVEMRQKQQRDALRHSLEEEEDMIPGRGTTRHRWRKRYGTPP